MKNIFAKEIDLITETIKWSFNEMTTIIDLQSMISKFRDYPLIIVGSGGSLSCAQFITQIHQQIFRTVAKAVTPLEFYYLDINPLYNNVLLLTAGGNNKDIINSFDLAVKREFRQIGIICANKNSKICKKAKNYPYIKILEYVSPAKDGFLALNSILSTCILTGRAYNAFSVSKIDIGKILSYKIKDFERQGLDKILSRKTIVVLGGGWSWPAVIDLESKFSEAGLGNILISDIRNFGHGRHNWFVKRGDETALLFLSTPNLSKLVDKTASLIPKKYPIVTFTTKTEGPLASIEMFNYIFQIVNIAGKLAGIDPGCPGVPEFGRKIYHIGIPKTLIKSKITNKDCWIQRKVRISGESEDIWKKRLNKFLFNIGNTLFSGIVFDYDGTLCDAAERHSLPVAEIKEKLNWLLEEGIIVGIATGRGKSIKTTLRKVIDKKHWEKLLIGIYNGVKISALSDNIKIDHNNKLKCIKRAEKLIKSDIFISQSTEMEARRTQISLKPYHFVSKSRICGRLKELLDGTECIKIVETDHSFDVLSKDVSKKNVVNAIRGYYAHKSFNILNIGDQGQYCGNDFELLSLPFSISVDKLSTLPETCWNLSPVGVRGAKAALAILKAMRVQEGRIRIDIKYLEKAKD